MATQPDSDVVEDFGRLGARLRGLKERTAADIPRRHDNTHIGRDRAGSSESFSAEERQRGTTGP